MGNVKQFLTVFPLTYTFLRRDVTLRYVLLFPLLIEMTCCVTTCMLSKAVLLTTWVIEHKFEFRVDFPNRKNSCLLYLLCAMFSYHKIFIFKIRYTLDIGKFKKINKNTRLHMSCYAFNFVLCFSLLFLFLYLYFVFFLFTDNGNAQF